MSKSVLAYLDEISEKMKSLKGRHDQYSNDECLFAYRGESKDYGATCLMPSLFRDSEYVQKEAYLFELLKDYEFIKDLKSRNIDQAIEAQHYIAISRMLDITFNTLTALYFACASNKGQNGRIYIFCFPEYYSPNSNYIEEFYSNILEDRNLNITYANNFKVITHSFSNERIKAQNGGFIFFPGDDFRKISNIYYETIEIHEGDKKGILEELNRLFRVNRATLFPSKEELKDIVKEKFKQGNYQRKKISVQEEINDYFNKLEYEMAMNKRSESEDRIQANSINRLLRKEKSDLVYYLNVSFEKESNTKNLTKDALEKFIEERFELLQFKYGGSA